MKPVEKPGRGVLLLASPRLQDPNFSRTVVLICDHGASGTWGLVLNRRTRLTYGELIDDIPFPGASAGPVHWGGPCSVGSFQLLHRLRRPMEPDLTIGRNIRLGVDPEALRELLGESLLPGEALRAFVGHAGWGEGQLDAEMKTGSWILARASSSLVFDTEPAAMWAEALRSLGNQYAGLADFPADVRYN
ncbi:MAG: YqgE/AlgH family protein [Gemmatimonadota bacterium]|nr:YqgE/AlgH family protein [Gemmatimonadota bacterium]MDP6529230.1 YqgE/AlgH family protein [Gemmatimonadota bacterium]MDP6802891.1 YqgE/AlgH family protein [Gemmatimonadota bacterium]MDP7031439.1 YqgE/AlgH family protein [Gemmatimonadota bacterium]